MENEVQVLVLTNGITLISKVAAVVSELGEPDCKLIKPMEIVKDIVGNTSLKKWLSDLTDNTDAIMISSDKILTLVDPKDSLLNDYLTLIQ
jgi:hypothetical protein